jgi:glyoxylase-like metal-dependent hydrolase (beta-lactamase superfamily II)
MAKFLFIAALALSASFTIGAAQAQTAPSSTFAQDIPRDLVHIAGDVYRFQNNAHYSLVTVTNDDVVVVDPINAAAATWLKDKLNDITDKPVTTLIYSHSHADHASGGMIYEAKTVLAHQNAPEQIDGVTPTLRVDDTHVLEVGGKTFETTYLGEGHGSDMIAVVVRPENVGFITDVAAPKRLPFRTLPSSSVDAWIEQVKKVDTLDFEIFAPSHGNMGVRSDVGDVITYMETLRAEVLAGLKAGESIETLQETVLMAEYSDWLGYASMRADNVQGMAEYLVKADKVH